jgi:CPA1 family monovalent cation:H+ antiporter
MSNFITVAVRNPGWKTPLIFGWTGMRGVVSLAAALSIPVFVQGDELFPYRNLILVITFIVILVTLVFQGLTLPWLIRKLNVEDTFSTIPELEQEIIIQKKIAKYSLQYLEEKHGSDWVKNEHLDNLRSRLETELRFFRGELEETGNTNTSSKYDYQQIYLELLDHQRKLLKDLNKKSEFDEELIRKYLLLIDLEEFKTREKQLQLS